jgi:hypothetical protein
MSLHSNEISREEIRAQSEKFETAPLADILRWAWDRFGKRAAIGTSFQGAGLVMIHHAVREGIPLPVFTLDTQLLFPETLELKRQLEAFFELPIEALLPDQTPEEDAPGHLLHVAKGGAVAAKAGGIGCVDHWAATAAERGPAEDADPGAVPLRRPAGSIHFEAEPDG